MAAPEITAPPLGKPHSMAPLDALSAYMVSPAAVSEPPYTTPLAVETKPMSGAPCGSAVCHRIFPVAASSADHDPPAIVDVWPDAEVMVYGVCSGTAELARRRRV